MQKLKLFEIPDDYCRLFVFQMEFEFGFYQAVLLFDREGMGAGERTSGKLTCKERHQAHNQHIDWSAGVIDAVRDELGV